MCVFCVPRSKRRQASPTPNQRSLRRQSTGGGCCRTQLSPSVPNAGSRSGGESSVTIRSVRLAGDGGSLGLKVPRANVGVSHDVVVSVTESGAGPTPRRSNNNLVGCNGKCVRAPRFENCPGTTASVLLPLDICWLRENVVKAISALAHFLVVLPCGTRLRTRCGGSGKKNQRTTTVTF